MRISSKQKKEVISLRKQGKSYSAISLFTGVPRGDIDRILKEAVKQ
ncbi:hypothetical protein [Clostridium pasteurianum]|nr:hypothetical protein [Clostridium pasteurianum]